MQVFPAVHFRGAAGNQSVGSGDKTLEILIALNLATEAGRITNAALLLFAKNPQRQRDLSCSPCFSGRIKTVLRGLDLPSEADGKSSTSKDD